MAHVTAARANLLGDLRAEFDRSMLTAAFLETADYKTLIDTTDRPVVIGRRGTGKSALADRLQEILRDPAKYEALRRAAWERAKTFHWSRILPPACDWLEQMAGAGEPAPSAELKRIESR